MSDISHSCLLQAIVEHAEHMPDKIALVCDVRGEKRCVSKFGRSENI